MTRNPQLEELLRLLHETRSAPETERDEANVIFIGVAKKYYNRLVHDDTTFETFLDIIHVRYRDCGYARTARGGPPTLPPKA